jgi:hypothetical protein
MPNTTDEMEEKARWFGKRQVWLIAGFRIAAIPELSTSGHGGYVVSFEVNGWPASLESVARILAGEQTEPEHRESYQEMMEGRAS